MGTLFEEVHFTCLCGQAAGVARTEDGFPAVVHAVPWCDDFEKLEPADYIAVVRLAAEGPAGKA
jgi:hypothetical protein